MARTLATGRTLVSQRNLVGDESFVPNTLPNCLYWFKADGLVLNDDDLITSMTDFSGNGYNFNEGSDASRPTFKTNIINGLPVARFAGGQGRQLPVANEAVFDLLSFTIFAVAVRTSGTGATLIAKNTTGTSGGGRRKLQIQISGTSLSLSSGADGSAVSQSGVTTTDWNIYNVVARASNDNDLVINGTVNNKTTLLNHQAFNDAKVEIGQAFSNGAERLVGDIAELIVYGRALNSTDWQGVYNYLSNKYALGSDFSPASRTLAVGRTLA